MQDQVPWSMLGIGMQGKRPLSQAMSDDEPFLDKADPVILPVAASLIVRFQSSRMTRRSAFHRNRRIVDDNVIVCDIDAPPRVRFSINSSVFFARRTQLPTNSALTSLRSFITHSKPTMSTSVPPQTPGAEALMASALLGIRSPDNKEHMVERARSGVGLSVEMPMGANGGGNRAAHSQSHADFRVRGISMASLAPVYPQGIIQSPSFGFPDELASASRIPKPDPLSGLGEWIPSAGHVYATDITTIDGCSGDCFPCSRLCSFGHCLVFEIFDCKFCCRCAAD